MPVVTLFGKPGCCLCEEARDVVNAVRSTHELELREVDVSLDPALNRDFGERIPVISIDGDEAFEYRVDAEALKRRLDRVTP